MNITAVIEVTENCNLGCTFCLRPSFSKLIMSYDILKKVISHILNYSNDRIDFIWHGGEPLLAGLKFFKEIIKIQKQYNKKGLIIINNVQTNATLLNDDFIKFFQKEKFEIGTSIQGTKEIHDSTRVTINGKPTYKIVISKLSKLKQKPGSIVVLTKDILGKEKKVYWSIKPYVRGIRISEYFPRDNLRNSKNINESHMPTPKEYGESIIRFYEIWKKDPSPIDLRPITEIIRSFVIGKSSGCLYSQEACAHSIIGVKSSGDFYTCIRGAPNRKFFLGHVDEKPLNKYFKKAQKDKKKRIKKLGSCKSCKYWNYCNGGCPLESFKLYGNLDNKTWYCEGRKMLFEHIFRDLSQQK